MRRNCRVCYRGQSPPPACGVRELRTESGAWSWQFNWLQMAAELRLGRTFPNKGFGAQLWWPKNEAYLAGKHVSSAPMSGSIGNIATPQPADQSRVAIQHVDAHARRAPDRLQSSLGSLPSTIFTWL